MAPEDLNDGEGRDDAPAPLSPFHYVMQRIAGPAAAIVILYASIRVFPSWLTGHTPPVGLGDLVLIFLVAMAGFVILAFLIDRRSKAGNKDA